MVEVELLDAPAADARGSTAFEAVRQRLAAEFPLLTGAYVLVAVEEARRMARWAGTDSGVEPIEQMARQCLALRMAI